MVGDYSWQMKTHICTVRDVGDGFRSLPIPITNKYGVSRKHVSDCCLESLAQEAKKNNTAFFVGFCLTRIENLALTSERTQMYWERRSISSCASMLLYKCRYICVQDSIFGALSISRQIHNREKLGKTSGNYPIYKQNLGWSAKSRNPTRLGFSRHMINRLHPIYRQNLEWPAKSKIADRLGFFRHMKNRLYFCEFTSLMAEQ